MQYENTYSTLVENVADALSDAVIHCPESTKAAVAAIRATLQHYRLDKALEEFETGVVRVAPTPPLKADA